MRFVRVQLVHSGVRLELAVMRHGGAWRLALVMSISQRLHQHYAWRLCIVSTTFIQSTCKAVSFVSRLPDPDPALHYGLHK